MSDNDMIIGIRAQTDAATFAQAKAAVIELGGAFEKTTAEIQRTEALDKATKSFVQMAVTEKNAAAAAVELGAQLKALNATDAEIEKVVKAFDKEVAAIQRTEAAAAKAATAAASATAKEAAAAEAKAAKEIAAIQRTEAAAEKKAANDTKRAAQQERDVHEIEARAENARRDAIAAPEIDASPVASAETGPTLGGRLTRAGSALRGLPSVQIPGTGIGTDAIGNITRLSGSLLDVAGKSSLVTAATDILTPALGAQAAATIGAAAPAAIFIVAFAAIGLAIKSLVDATSQNVTKINTFADSQRTLSDKIVGGLTSKEAKEQLDDINERRARENGTLTTLKESYKSFERQAQTAGGAGTELGENLKTFGGLLGPVGLAAGHAGDLISGATKVFSGDEQALADQIGKSQEVYDSTAGDVQSLITVLSDGSLAANDAKVAEEELAKTRSDNALNAADTAGKELQNQQKALASTEEQNKKRLESIEDERDVIQKQIDVLTDSGVTSDEVTAKLESLNGQLGLLGKESKFISDVALAASRAADAEKKAAEEDKKRQKEAEQTRESIAKSEAAYATKQIDLEAQSQQRLDDLQTAAGQKEFDTDLAYYRDTVKLAADARNKEAEAQKKFDRDAEDDVKDANRKLEDIRQKALDDVASNLDSRNFLEANRAERGLKKQEDVVLKESERATEDRLTLQRREEEDRYDDLRQARDARKVQLDQQIEDNNRALNRQIEQADLAAERASSQAELAHERELSALQIHMDELTGVREKGYAAELAAAQGVSGAQSAANGGSTQAGITAATHSGYAPPTGSFGGLRPITTNTSRSTVNNVTINTDSDQRIIRILGEAGVLGQQ